MGKATAFVKKKIRPSARPTKKEEIDEVDIYNIGTRYLSVCAATDMPQQEVERQVNELWTAASEGLSGAAKGTPERIQRELAMHRLFCSQLWRTAANEDTQRKLALLFEAIAARSKMPAAQWKMSADEKFVSGDPNPSPCILHKKERLHYLMECQPPAE